MDYSKAKFLVYNCWTEGQIAGSLLLDGAFNEEEAKEKIELYKERHNHYNSKYPSDTKTRFVYIVNNPDWWTNYKVI